MPDIAILTPDPADPSYVGQWPGVLERLQAALALSGVTAVATPWTDHVDCAEGLRAYPLVLGVLVWGYHRDHERWIKATTGWAEAGIRLANPAAVLGWNSDKSYLGRLAERGVAIPPTLWTDQVVEADIETAFERFGAETLVIKPTVSGGAYRTLKLARGEAFDAGAAPIGAAMIQPYLPAIAEEGELSLLFFGDRFSHAVNKRPVAGEFRIQVQFGGLYTPVADPPVEAISLAEQVLAAVDEPLLYARIDMVRDGAGNWLLMEAELIEPDFYLGSAPDKGAAFAEAVRALL